MGDKSGINWTDATWNPTTGCDKVSPGCDHCYALDMAKRLKGMGQANYQTDGDPETSGPGFGIAMHPHMLDKPLHWTRPRRIFVNSMSDLFHSGVTREPWPLPNVHVGTSVEDQKRADLRIPLLIATPAVARFLSMEPLLGPVDLRGGLGFAYDDQATGERIPVPAVDWVIVGGESGRGARPMDLDWVRSLRDECTAAGVAFWYKQQGTGDGGDQHRRELDGRTWDEFPVTA